MILLNLIHSMWVGIKLLIIMILRLDYAMHAGIG